MWGHLRQTERDVFSLAPWLSSLHLWKHMSLRDFDRIEVGLPPRFLWTCMTSGENPEKIPPKNLGGESSKNTCFWVFSGAHSLNLGVEIMGSQGSSLILSTANPVKLIPSRVPSPQLLLACPWRQCHTSTATLHVWVAAWGQSEQDLILKVQQRSCAQCLLGAPWQALVVLLDLQTLTAWTGSSFASGTRGGARGRMMIGKTAAARGGGIHAGQDAERMRKEGARREEVQRKAEKGCMGQLSRRLVCFYCRFTEVGIQPLGELKGACAHCAIYHAFREKLLALLTNFIIVELPRENDTKGKSGCRKRSAAKGVRSLFCFRDAFGHFSVTFSDASVTFFVTFLPNSFARLLLRQGEKEKSRNSKMFHLAGRNSVLVKGS